MPEHRPTAEPDLGPVLEPAASGDLAEQVPVRGRPAAGDGEESLPPAAPEADALEQRYAVVADDDGGDDGEGHSGSAPDDVDAADLLDQRRVVEIDDDDYR